MKKYKSIFSEEEEYKYFDKSSTDIDFDDMIVCPRCGGIGIDPDPEETSFRKCILCHGNKEITKGHYDKLQNFYGSQNEEI